MKLHKLEIAFDREFTEQEVEDLKDAIYEFLANYELATDLQLTKHVDLIVLDA